MNKPKLSIEIVSAITESNGMAPLGDGRSKWLMAKDLKRFREITTGSKSTMAIASATFTAMRTNKYPLFTHRHNVVIGEYDPIIATLEDHEIATDIETAIDLAAARGSERVFLVGDANFYRASFDRVSKLHLTIVKGRYNTSDQFPSFSEDFEAVFESPEDVEDNGIAYVFKQYVRR